MGYLHSFTIYDFNERKIIKRVEKDWSYSENFPLCYWQILVEFFPDYKIEDHQGDKKGIPDFKLINKKNPSETIWIEMKKDGDGINENQLSWMFKNKDKNIYIFYIKYLRLEL